MSIFGLGPLPKETTETPSAPALGDYGDLAARIQKQSEARRAYFDQLTEQLKARRYGPSASERLFAISAALAQPTRTPGFGGMLANVTPVFEQYAKDKRAAETARASDMEKLGLARLNLGDDEIKTALELQQLQDRYKIAKLQASKPPPPGEKERLIARALSLPENDPERKLILASITGTPENIAAMVSKAEGIQGTKPPPSSKAGNPKYKQSGNKFYKWSPN